MILTNEQILEAIAPALKFHAERFAARRKGMEVKEEGNRVVVVGLGANEQFGNGEARPQSWVEQELMNTGNHIE